MTILLSVIDTNTHNLSPYPHIICPTAVRIPDTHTGYEHGLSKCAVSFEESMFGNSHPPRCNWVTVQLADSALAVWDPRLSQRLPKYLLRLQLPCCMLSMSEQRHTNVYVTAAVLHVRQGLQGEGSIY